MTDASMAVVVSNVIGVVDGCHVQCKVAIILASKIIKVMLQLIEF